MAIKSYTSLADYNSATLSTIESQVSLIETNNEIIIDGVNVVTTEPTVGDVLFLNESNKKVFLKGGAWLQKATIPSAWTLVGYVIWRSGRKVKILEKTAASVKYAAYAEYSITAISSTDVTLNLRLSNDYNSYTAVTVTLADTSLNDANALAIKNAIIAKCTEVSATNVPWAYYDSTNNKIVIVVAWNDYRQYMVSGTGCTIALSIWDDMPYSNNSGFRSNGLTGSLHSMNLAKSVSYYGTNGTTPEANVTVNASTGPVTLSAFNTSSYCADLRAAYDSYSSYIKAEYMVMYPQILGVFGLPDAKYLTETYGNRTVVLADGTTAYAFPALHRALTIGYNCEGMETGDWYLSGVEDGSIYMKDDVLAKVAASQTKMGTTVLTNSASRWFAQRYSVYYAWFFYGSHGSLSANHVCISILSQAVLLLEI